jgi:hypothetical protein
MKTTFQVFFLIPALCAAVAASAQTAPIVEVSFDKPEEFRDAYPRSRGGSEAELKQTLDAVQRIFAEQGARLLKPGDKLKVAVTDLDLAGEIEPGRTGVMDMRVLRRITWPMMTVRYSLTRDGEETSAEVKLSEPGYQDNSGFCARSGDHCYERQMVRRWMQRQFG